MAHYKMLPATKWSLDYERLTAAELRQLIHDRMGATLDQKETRTIRNCNRYQLINRLRKLDREGSFPRFMELPPELRVSVYEFLLVDTTEQDGNEADPLMRSLGHHSSTLHPAVLRTSKQVYSEAQPVLYQKNKFRATIVYSDEEKYRWGPRPGCLLTVIQSGSRAPFRQKESYFDRSPSLYLLFKSRAIGMLRSLTHLTLYLNLVTPGEEESDGYVPRTCNSIACLCLSLTGASKMKEQTINVEVGHPQERSKVDFARILWPLAFLRTDIEVRFEGIAELLKTSTAGLRRDPHAEASYGRHIARIRQRCNEEIAKQGSDRVGLHDVEVALTSMNYFGDHFISMDDIVNLSAAWTGMRNKADSVEAEDLGKKSLV
jgi:hypothetical protein